jgi:hypothetical protein
MPFHFGKDAKHKVSTLTPARATLSNPPSYEQSIPGSTSSTAEPPSYEKVAPCTTPPPEKQTPENLARANPTPVKTTPIKLLSYGQNFMSNIVPNFTGPQVILRIVQNANQGIHEDLKGLDLSGKDDSDPDAPVDFKVSKALLVEKSGYFASLFKDDPFGDNESYDEVHEIAIIPGTLSRKSVEKMILWLYRGYVVFEKCDWKLLHLQVSQFLELASLAEYWEISDPLLENHLVTSIERIALHKDDGYTAQYKRKGRGKVQNTKDLTDEHLDSVFALSSFSKLKDVFIMVVVESHIQHGVDPYESREYRAKLYTFEYAKNRLNQFCADVMRTEKVEIRVPASNNRATLPKAAEPTASIIFKDLFSGKSIVRHTGWGQVPL